MFRISCHMASGNRTAIAKAHRAVLSPPFHGQRHVMLALTWRSFQPCRQSGKKTRGSRKQQQQCMKFIRTQAAMAGTGTAQRFPVVFLIKPSKQHPVHTSRTLFTKRRSPQSPSPHTEPQWAHKAISCDTCTTYSVMLNPYSQSKVKAERICPSSHTHSSVSSSRNSL